MKNLEKKKLYLIIRIDLKSEILAMLSIKVITKLGVIIYQVKFEDRHKSIKKNIKHQKS